ncbi:MAG: hypothetical protein CBE10_00375 [bacterium TMED250]|nr:MAG: hypothetical protein CBE10_00375 [bacterium TMED250]
MKESRKSKLHRREFFKKSAAGIIGSVGSVYANTNFRVANDFKRPSSSTDLNWSAINSNFILKNGVTYMNNASLGMPPMIIVDAVKAGYEGISKEPLHGKRKLQDKISKNVIPLLASTFNVKTDEVILTRNASEALFLQTLGLVLKKGDEVVLSTQEHPAALKPWIHRGAKDGVILKYVYIPSPLVSKQDTINRLMSAVSSKTKAISFCHVTRGGHKYPVKEIANLARRKGIATLVDGAQAVGQFPIDIKNLGCDAYSASLHKWILAPSGSGFLFVRDNAKRFFESPFDLKAPTINSFFDPPGTKDYPVRAAVGTALNFINKIGLDNIEKRCRYLSDYLKDGLKKIKDVKILSSDNYNLSAPGSTIFEKKNLDALESVKIFEKKINFHIDEHQRDGHDAIRVSTHFYNNTDQIDLFLDTLNSI